MIKFSKRNALLTALVVSLFSLFSIGQLADAAEVEGQEAAISKTAPLVRLLPSGETQQVFQSRSADGSVLVADYILNQAQVNTMAENMKTLQGSALQDVLTILFTGYLGNGGPVINAAIIASRNAVLRQEIIDAAARGQRVRVLIYDDTPHTSYSTTLQFIPLPRRLLE